MQSLQSQTEAIQAMPLTLVHSLYATSLALDPLVRYQELMLLLFMACLLKIA